MNVRKRIRAKVTSLVLEPSGPYRCLEVWPLCRGKDGGTVDRCALFVDASYVLADGAMAVHGTRRGESVSWDYEGLLQLLSSLARERSGLPVLRCYWYEATV